MKCIVVILPGSISIHQVYKQKNRYRTGIKLFLHYLCWKAPLFCCTMFLMQVAWVFLPLANRF